MTYIESTVDQIAEYKVVRAKLATIKNNVNVSAKNEKREAMRTLQSAWTSLTPTSRAFLFMKYGDQEQFWIQGGTDLVQGGEGRITKLPEGMFQFHGKVFTLDLHTSVAESLFNATVEPALKDKAAALARVLNEKTGLLAAYDLEGDTALIHPETSRYMAGEVYHGGATLSLWSDFGSKETERDQHETDDQWAAAVEKRFTALWDEYKEEVAG